MPRVVIGLLALLSTGLPLSPFSPASRSLPPVVREADKHKGMSYVHAWRRAERRGYGSERSEASLERLRTLGVSWVSITPFGFQRTPQDTSIRWGGSRISESDERLRAVTRQAHALGLRVMLKPHVWLRPPDWVGLIEHRSERAWQTWFDAYAAFILHYARLAEETEVDALCIGNELARTTYREEDWRRVIGEIREVYAGPMTYGAVTEEVHDVPFWDALDYIGLSAYYPLVEAREPTRAALVQAWQPIVADLAALSGRWQKPIVFTELGYRSADFGAWRHWEITADAPTNLASQANAYAAFFETVWPQPWFAGVYWWKWFSFLEDGGPTDNDFTPRRKPAENAIAAGYGGH